MGNHTITYMQLADNSGLPKKAGRCACGAYSGKQGTKQEVDDWWFTHTAQVERVRAALGTRNPTLKGQRDYYRSMAENPDVEESDRDLWRQLADELDRRLNESDVAAEQGTLPF